MKHSLTHLDHNEHPRMVDVSAKPETVRTAAAEATVRFPASAWEKLAATGFATRKGPVADIARIAGIQAVKRTDEWIPLCHTLPVDGCEIAIEPGPGEPVLRIECRVRTTARTGVEMEALVGASAAALTVYDMTKSLGHGIELERTRLLSKTGGKSDYRAPE